MEMTDLKANNAAESVDFVYKVSNYLNAFDYLGSAVLREMALIFGSKFVRKSENLFKYQI